METTQSSETSAFNTQTPRLKADVSELCVGSIFNRLKMEPTQSSETPAFNTQTPGKYPEDNLSTWDFHWASCKIPAPEQNHQFRDVSFYLLHAVFSTHQDALQFFAYLSMATLYQLNNFYWPSHLNLTLSRNVNAAKCTGISICLVNSSESSSGWYSAFRKESLVFSYGMDLLSQQLHTQTKFAYLQIKMQMAFAIDINSFISIQPLGRFNRNQKPVRRPVCLWHTASWASS
jgi:hypothetical protein